MSKTQQRQRQVSVELPDTLDTTDAKLVYLYLHIEQKATINELQAALGMKKVTLYPLLETLTTTDLIKRVGTTYVYQEQTPDGGTS